MQLLNLTLTNLPPLSVNKHSVSHSDDTRQASFISLLVDVQWHYWFAFQYYVQSYMKHMINNKLDCCFPVFQTPGGGTCYIYIQGCMYEGSNSNPKIWIHCKFCTQKYCDPAYLLPKNMGDNFILVINLIAQNYFWGIT